MREAQTRVRIDRKPFSGRVHVVEESDAADSVLMTIRIVVCVSV